MHFGVNGYLDEIDAASRWLADHKDLYLDVVDPLEGISESIIAGIETRGHMAAPPTMHPRARLHRQPPAKEYQIQYAYVAQDHGVWPGWVERLAHKAVIVADVKEPLDVNVWPLYHCRGTGVFRVDYYDS